MWKNDLEERRRDNKELPLPILLNAWEEDYCGDPLLSVIHGLTVALEAVYPKTQERKALSALKEAAKDTAWYSISLANSMVAHWTGLDPSKAGEYAEEKKGGRTGKPSRPDLFRIFEKRRESLRVLKASLRSVFCSPMLTAVVLVDELDRCRPDFAVHYLETIKHVFEIDGLVFILAVDTDQLENSAKALFGANLKFPEYYRKFAHRNIALPAPDVTGMRNLITRYTDQYLDDPAEENPRRKTWMNIQDSRRILIEVITTLRLNPRQTQEVFRILGHMTAAPVENDGSTLLWHVAASAIFLATLRVGQPTEFQKIEQDKMKISELVDLLIGLFPKKSHEWWAFLLVTRLSADEDTHDVKGHISELVRVGILPKETTEDEFRRRLGGYGVDFFRGSSLRKIAGQIDGILRFAD